MFCSVRHLFELAVAALTVTGTRKYIPALTVINKIDSVSMETVDSMARAGGDGKTVMISCELDLGIDWLLEAVWKVSRAPLSGLARHDRTTETDSLRRSWVL